MKDSEPLAPDASEALPRPFGAYTLLREIGRGSMGIVYEALHRDLARTVALKVLRVGHGTEPESRERFRREARTCAQVRHDHIVQIYEAGELDGLPFLAMDLVPGESLSTLLKSGRAPPPIELMRGLAGVADALHALHGAGIVHRDVKPANVLVRPDGRMILADFGLAHTALGETLTQSGEMLGTPLYMCPEQIAGVKAELDARADVYSLGATLYEALSGRPLFPTDSSIPALIAMILSVRPSPLRGLSPDVPAACEHIVLKALEKRREDRYPSAAAMRDDMLAFAAGGPVIGRPVSRPKRAFRWIARHRAALAVAAVASLGVSWWWMHRPATLVLATRPHGAAAWIDATQVGTTPASLTVAPGTHHVALRRAGYKPWAERVVLRSGADLSFDIGLIVADVRNAAVVNEVATPVGVKLPMFQLPEGDRAPPEGESVELLIPRGDVRIEDLRLIELTVDGERFRPSGALEFRRGDSVLWSAAFAPSKTPFVLDIPAEVREAARSGEAVTWGWWPTDAPQIVTTFRVVPSDAAAKLQEIDRTLEIQPKVVRRTVRAQALLDRGLFTGAYLEARAIADDDSKDVRAWAVMERALVGMGATASREASSIRTRLRNFPAAERESVFAHP